MKDSSIPNSRKACSAALFLFPSRRFLAGHRQTLRGSKGGWKRGWVLDVLETIFHVFSGVLKETLHSPCLWEREKYNRMLLDLWS